MSGVEFSNLLILLPMLLVIGLCAVALVQLIRVLSLAVPILKKKNEKKSNLKS